MGEAGARPDQAQPDARRRGAHAGAAAAAVSLCESMGYINVVDDAAAAGYVEQGNKTTNTRCVSRAAKDEHDERGCGSLEGWQWLLATHMHARGAYCLGVLRRRACFWGVLCSCACSSLAAVCM